VPVILLARLAVDHSAQGQKLGESLLDALGRSLTLAEALGIHAVEVDAIDQQAKAFLASFLAGKRSRFSRCLQENGIGGRSRLLQKKVGSADGAASYRTGGIGGRSRLLYQSWDGSRTLNSSFQRRGSRLLWHQSSRVPTSLTFECRRTETVSPWAPSSTARAVSRGASSWISSGFQRCGGQKSAEASVLTFANCQVQCPQSGR